MHFYMIYILTLTHIFVSIRAISLVFNYLYVLSTAVNPVSERMPRPVIPAASHGNDAAANKLRARLSPRPETPGSNQWICG